MLRKIISGGQTCADRAALALVFLLFFAMPSICCAWSGKVVHVADGDTVTVEKGGKAGRVPVFRLTWLFPVNCKYLSKSGCI